MKEIKLMADYHCSPLWAVLNDGFFENIELDNAVLALPSEIKIPLQLWQDKYDAILNQDDPASSGFKTPAEADNFETDGVALWQKLITLFPDATVSYFSDKYACLFDDPANYEIRKGIDNGTILPTSLLPSLTKKNTDN